MVKIRQHVTFLSFIWQQLLAFVAGAGLERLVLQPAQQHGFDFSLEKAALLDSSSCRQSFCALFNLYSGIYWVTG